MQAFRQDNAHLPEIKNRSAIDVSTVDRRQLVEAKVIADDLPYTNGAIGNALSHMSFCKLATGAPVPITFGIDIMMSSVYPDINAHVAFPPLAVTRNEHANSTVQPRR